MASLTVNNASRAGIDLAGTAAGASGDTIVNSGQELAVFFNDSLAAIDITFVTTTTVDSRAVGDRAVSIAAGATVAYGPFPTGIYSALLQMTYSTETDLYVTALKVTPA